MSKFDPVSPSYIWLSDRSSFASLLSLCFPAVECQTDRLVLKLHTGFFGVAASHANKLPRDRVASLSSAHNLLGRCFNLSNRNGRWMKHIEANEVYFLHAMYETKIAIDAQTSKIGAENTTVYV